MSRLKALLASLLVVMTMLVSASAPAAAWREIEWCAEDPVFEVLGSKFRITTTVQAPASAVSSIDYVLEVPSNAEGTVKVKFPSGRKALPTTVEIRYTGSAADGSFTVHATVTASATQRADLTADLSGPNVERASFAGRTNTPLSFEFDVSAK